MEAEGRELTTRCETNFLTGRSQSYPILPIRRPRKVVVVGGGPGGLEAARVAALRGCKVKLYDENDRLGGALVAASIPQFMEEFRRVIDFYETQLKRLDVEVVLHQRILPADTHADQPDSLILALGARSITPMVPGKDKPIVGHAIDALLGKFEFGDRVLLIGGNFISCQIAAHLAEQDREVTLVTQRRQESQLAGELERFSQRELIRMLKKLRVKTILGHRLSEIIDGGGIFQTGEIRNVVFEVDNVLLSLGYLPKRQELKKFMGHAQLVHAVGDCVRPRRMGPAIWEGFIAGYEA
jgi:2-enoate reductase